MSTTTSLTTADDLLRMPDDGFRYELIAGRLKGLSYYGAVHGAIVVQLSRFLANHVELNNLGQVCAETGFRLAQDPDTVRAPDIAFIQSSRIPRQDFLKRFGRELRIWLWRCCLQTISPRKSRKKLTTGWTTDALWSGLSVRNKKQSPCTVPKPTS
jgi:hypothetical protein